MPQHPVALVALNWLILVTVVALSIWLLRPPEPVPASARGVVFSAGRAIEHVRVIARAPHSVGTAANEEVRRYLMDQLSRLGLQPQVQSGTGFSAFHVWEGGVRAGNVHNVLGRLPGAANTRAVLLVAHYDSHEQGPGAGDDGAAVAAILETIRAVKAQSPLRNDVIVLFTDGEESGGLGADLFATSHPWVKDIGLALNFDNHGDAGPAWMGETSEGNRWLIEQYAAASPYPFASSFFYTGLLMKGGSPTDLPDLMRGGLAGLNFGFGANSHVLHTRLDTADNLSQASLQHEGSHALALARHFGNLDLRQAPLKSGGDEVFFDWIGARLVHYPESWVLPMHIVLTIGLASLLIRATRQQRVRVRAMVYAALICAGALAAIPALLAGVRWRFDKAFRSRLLMGDTPSNWLLFTALIVLAMACAIWTMGFLRHRFGLLNLAAAGLVLSWIVTTALAIGLPASSYLLFWPLLFATASFAWLTVEERSMAAPLLAAVPALLLFGPFFYLLGQFGGALGIVTPVAVGVTVALLSVLLAPFSNGLAPGPSATRSVPALLLAGAAVLGVWGVVLSRFSTRHPRPDTILYVLNADNHHAIWLSFDDSPDAWTEQFLSGHPKRGNLPDYPHFSNNLWNSAPPIDLPAPEVQVLESSSDHNLRSLHLRVRSPRHATSVELNLGRSTELVAASIGGRDPFADKVRGRQGSPHQIRLIPFYGVPDEGVEMILKLKCAGPCNIGVYDRSLGLPNLPGFSPRPRPEDKMGWYGSNQTLVGREFRF